MGNDNLPKTLQPYLDSGVQLLTTIQAAAILGLSPQTLRKWTCKNSHPRGLKPIKIGRTVRWNIDDIAKVISNS